MIEAGSHGDSFIFNIPIGQPLLQRSLLDWQFETTSQENSCQALNENQSFWPMGKILGGTHRLNNMIYHKGHPSDYESFIDKEEAEKFFRENENFVQEGNFKSSLAENFIEAAKELGFEDFSFTNLTQVNGWRYTEVDRWKTMVAAPEVCRNAMVISILFDGENSTKAIGVEFSKNGKMHKVFGNKIVLSAGVIGSPKILMQSGIGPKNHLESIGIKVLVDLPVGENLQDHVTTGSDLIILNQTVGLDLKNILNPFKILDFFIFNGDSSPLSFGGCDAMGFVKLNLSSKAPDLSLMLLPVGLVADSGIHLRKIQNIRDRIWQEYFKPLRGQTTITILPVLLHPKSRGSVKLKSKNFNDPPIINPNYLSDEDDVKKLITGIRIIKKLVETSSMQKFGAEINPKKFPGCENLVIDSNDYWECYLRHMTLTMFHPVGTCRIGEFDEKSTVVLKNFQVKHTENLYVVDGSVLPKATSANPNAVIAMIAKKFAQNMSNLLNKT